MLNQAVTPRRFAYAPTPRRRTAIIRLPWTEERVDIMKAMWKDGHSAGQIASRLGGVTRNAVIGKLGRLGLLGTRYPDRTKAKRNRPPKLVVKPEPITVMLKQPKWKPVPIEQQIDVGTEPVSLGFSVFDLKAGRCTWGHGHPREAGFHFCGRFTAAGGKLSFCDFHARRVYRVAGG